MLKARHLLKPRQKRSHHADVGRGGKPSAGSFDGKRGVRVYGDDRTASPALREPVRRAPRHPPEGLDSNHLR